MGEITIEEILERGIKLPEDRLSFPVEEFEDYRDDLKRVGGIYTFTNEIDGWLYVGISADVSDRLMRHIGGAYTGSSPLFKKLEETKDVTLTIYKEINGSLREFYENYLIYTHNPKINKAKKSKISDGYGVSTTKYPKEIQDKIVQMYEKRMSRKEIERVTGVGKDAQSRVLKSNGIVLRCSLPKDALEKIPSRDNKIITLFEGGYANCDIARTMGLSDGIISHVVKRYCKNTGKETPMEVRIKEKESLRKAIVEIWESENKKPSQIAEHLNINVSTVYRAIKSKGGMRSKYSQQQRNDVIRLYEDGETLRKIEDVTGVRQASQSYILRASGITPNRNTLHRKKRNALTQVDRELRRGKVAHLYRKGWKRSEIAEHLNLTPDRVSKIYRQYLDRQEVTK